MLTFLFMSIGVSLLPVIQSGEREGADFGLLLFCAVCAHCCFLLG